MSNISKGLTKGTIGVITASALALVAASPATAQDRRDRNGIDTGDIIAGAVILGGIAAIAAATGNKRNDYRSYQTYDKKQVRPRRGNPRAAIERCIYAVEKDARRAGYRFANVTQIRDVSRERRGWEVRGRLVVREGRNGRYNRVNYSRNDRRGGYNRQSNGRFKCDISRGRIVGINYRGIRGLR